MDGWKIATIGGGLGVAGFLACGGGDLVSSDATGVRTAGLVREIECDGDAAIVTLEGASAADVIEVALTPTSLIGSEPLAPECEGLGQVLGLEVDVIAHVADDGSLVAERLEPVSG
jgi:hypothetical protein